MPTLQYHRIVDDHVLDKCHDHSQVHCMQSPTDFEDQIAAHCRRHMDWEAYDFLDGYQKASNFPHNCQAYYHYYGFRNSLRRQPVTVAETGTLQVKVS